MSNLRTIQMTVESSQTGEVENVNVFTNADSVTFADGDTFQTKLDNGDLTGPQGETGALDEAQVLEINTKIDNKSSLKIDESVISIVDLLSTIEPVTNEPSELDTAIFVKKPWSFNRIPYNTGLENVTILISLQNILFPSTLDTTSSILKSVDGTFMVNITDLQDGNVRYDINMNTNITYTKLKTDCEYLVITFDTSINRINLFIGGQLVGATHNNVSNGWEDLIFGDNIKNNYSGYSGIAIFNEYIVDTTRLNDINTDLNTFNPEPETVSYLKLLNQDGSERTVAIRGQYDDLTEDQKNELAFTYDDFTEEQLNLLIGPQGPTGSNGQSAYELAIQDGYSGTSSEWLDSLKGDDGDITLLVNDTSPSTTMTYSSNKIQIELDTINALILGLQSAGAVIVSVLPDIGEPNKFYYLIDSEGATTIHIWEDGAFSNKGELGINLEGYATTADVNTLLTQYVMTADLISNISGLIKSQYLPKSINKNTVGFRNKSHAFYGEKGPITEQGWTVTCATDGTYGSTTEPFITNVDEIVDGVVDRQVVMLHDHHNGNLAQATIPISNEDWDDIAANHSVFFGRSRLDNQHGTMGFVAAIQNDIVTKRYAVSFTMLNNDSKFLKLTSPDSACPLNIVLDGNNGNPAIRGDEWFTWDIKIPPGLGDAEIWINGYLLPQKSKYVTNDGGTGQNVLITTGSSSGMHRVSYHDKYGVTFMQEDTTKIIDSTHIDGYDILEIITPQGAFDITLCADENIIGREIGAELNVVLNNVNGKVIFEGNKNVLINGKRNSGIPVLNNGMANAINIQNNGNQYTLTVTSAPVFQ